MIYLFFLTRRKPIVNAWLLKNPPITLLHHQIKLRLEFRVEVMLHASRQIRILFKPCLLSLAHPTHRILNSIGREFGNFMRDDLLGHTAGRSSISHQLRVTGMIQTGEEKGCFVDGVANCQQTSSGKSYTTHNTAGLLLIVTHPWFCRMQATLSLPSAFAIWAPSS